MCYVQPSTCRAGKALLSVGVHDNYRSNCTLLPVVLQGADNLQGRGTIGRNMPRLEDLDNDLI